LVSNNAILHLDTPEIFWSEPALEPLYRAIRGYLEISQRFLNGLTIGWNC
jgi:uncharacterized Rmd1/YagE family protein